MVLDAWISGVSRSREGFDEFLNLGHGGQLGSRPERFITPRVPRDHARSSRDVIAISSGVEGRPPRARIQCGRSRHSEHTCNLADIKTHVRAAIRVRVHRGTPL